jgi:hypothetical protein
MAKVTVFISGAHLGSSNAVARISVLDHVFRFDRLRKARPTRAAVELVHRSEQRLARDSVAGPTPSSCCSGARHFPSTTGRPGGATMKARIFAGIPGCAFSDEDAALN